MNSFSLKAEGSRLTLTLSGEVTVQHASDLASALQAELTPDRILSVDASGLARFDAAILQILLSCAQSAADTVLQAASPAWDESFSRYASPDPFHSE